MHDRPLVYLDNAASAQKPEAVIEAMAGAMRGSYANVHRGLHTLANETTEAYEARARSRRAIHQCGAASRASSSPRAARRRSTSSPPGSTCSPGDEIVLSVMEHHSNIVPWHFLRERKGAVLKWIDIDDDGEHRPAGARGADRSAHEDGRDHAHVERARRANAGGGNRAHRARQGRAGAARRLPGGGARPRRRAGARCRLSTSSPATSSTGRPGIGVLYGKPERLAALPPFEGGGEMIDIVERERVTYNEPPHRFEAGTPPILEAIGLGAAIDWLTAQDRAAHRSARSGIARSRHGRAARTQLGEAARPARRTRAPSSRSRSRAHIPMTWRRSWTARASRSAPATIARSR